MLEPFVSSRRADYFFFRDKRQIGDLRTAEYLARITLDKNKLLNYLQMPSHCADIACGLVDVFERYGF